MAIVHQLFTNFVDAVGEAEYLVSEDKELGGATESELASWARVEAPRLWSARGEGDARFRGSQRLPTSTLMHTRTAVPTTSVIPSGVLVTQCWLLAIACSEATGLGYFASLML